MIKGFLSAAAVLIALCPAAAQTNDWVSQMQDPNVNFYTVQQNFEQYWAEREIEKGKGWKQFKRWEAFMEPRVYPDGERPSAEVISQVYGAVLGNNAQADLGQWAPIGPFNGPSLGGIGRVNRITFDPQNNNIVWSATPAGGLWKSIDGGQNWTTNTDKLTNLGISDVVIHPENSNIMYIGTGDRDAGDTYSFGVLKSTDGGNTWVPTGLTNVVTQQARINDLYIHPDHPDTLMACTNTGIFRTTDAGATWTSVRSGAHNEIVQKPDNPNVLYVATRNSGSNRIYKSVDNGVTWTVINSSVLPSSSRRIELAVTPDDDSYVYALYGNTSNGFGGIFRSTDEGANWTSRATSPNLLGWRTDGNDNGGQAWYDLALAVNPADKDELFVGGVNIWTSTNGGSSWSLAAHWYGGGGAPYVHADVHDLEYRPGTDQLYAATDGGIYRDMVNQFSWDALNDGLNITQYYKFSNAMTDTTHVVAGAQDNGTHYRRASGWDDIYGGDGMDCAIDTKDPNTVYVSVYYGDFSKSTNGGFSYNATFNLPPAGNGNWVTPFLMDPNHPDTLYAGFGTVWRSFNGGASFSQMSGGTGNGNIEVLAIAPEHNNVIFAGNAHLSFKSTDYGSTWTGMTHGGGRAVTGIAAAHDNPDHIIVTKSGYTTNDKVYESTDGGVTFTNLSSGLPNVPVNCVVIEDNQVHSVYIGTDLGVYYKDDNNPNWTSFNYNLPNVIVNELEINYINRKLRAATYGRGVWQSPLYSDLTAPTAVADVPMTACQGDTVTLTHSSEYSPDFYNWSISPSTFTFVNGTSASSENPQIVFQQKGLYDVGFSVENVIGEDSAFYPAGIIVGGFPISYTNDFESILDNSTWSYNALENGWEEVSSSQGQAFRANLFANNTATDYELISPALDLSGHDSVWLSFDYAYSGTTGNTSDSLLIYASSGCAENWTLVSARGEDGTGNFQTANAASTKFNPTAAQWCSGSSANCLDVNLKSFAGQEGVRIKFVAINEGGNDIYLDNVEVSGNPSLAPAPQFSAPQFTCALDTVTFTNFTNGSATSYEWTFTGPATIQSTDENPKIAFPLAGTYDVKLKAINTVGADSITQSAYVVVSPADSVLIELDYAGAFYCYNDTLKITATTSNTGNSPVFTWYINNVEAGNGSSPSFDFSQLTNGDEIYATVTSDAPCAFPSLAYSDTVVININPITSLSVSPVSNLCSTGSSVSLSATPAGGQFSGPGVSGGSFDPSQAGSGTHTVTYTYQDGQGCKFYETVNIEVEDPAQIVVDPSFAVCSGLGPRPLTAASPAGGTYSGVGVYNNNIYPDSVGAGQHPVTYTYSTPTCGVVTKTFDVTVYGPVNPIVIVKPNLLECSVNATFYQWYRGSGASIPGANGKTYVPSGNDTYRVDILDSNGCFARSAYTSYSVGLEEIPLGFNFDLYPNPADHILNIDMEYSQLSELNLSLTNMAGQIVYSENVLLQGQSSKSIDLSNLPQGIYTLRVQGEKLFISKKVVVKH